MLPVRGDRGGLLIKKNALIWLEVFCTVDELIINTSPKISYQINIAH